MYFLLLNIILVPEAEINANHALITHIHDIHVFNCLVLSSS